MSWKLNLGRAGNLAAPVGGNTNQLAGEISPSIDKARNRQVSKNTVSDVSWGIQAKESNHDLLMPCPSLCQPVTLYPLCKTSRV
jgi:hypothetical protein